MGGRGADYYSPAKTAAREQRRRDKEAGISAEAAEAAEVVGFVDNTPAPPPEQAKSPEEQRMDTFYESWEARRDAIYEEAGEQVSKVFTMGNKLKAGQSRLEQLTINETKVNVLVQKLSAEQRKQMGTNEKFKIAIGDATPFYASTRYSIRSGGALDAFTEAEREGAYRARYGN